MILYIENLKESTKNLQKPINKFGKFAEYKINIHKSYFHALTMNNLKNFKNSI